MGARRPPAKELTQEQRTEAQAERERRRLQDAVDRLLGSHVAQGFAANVEDPTVLARIAAILVEHGREQRSHGTDDD